MRAALLMGTEAKSERPACVAGEGEKLDEARGKKKAAGPENEQDRPPANCHAPL
jgi:hypothetical protein